tara:strand:- start:1306 stop:1641 length:336 start_codon:yes stop_codon:yes gene_type:complete
MRKIEMRMNNALRNQTNFTSGNTAIFTTGNESRVYLHSNLIATIYRDGNVVEVTLFDGGWQSNTTKSRLNAICSEFLNGARVFQKNWNWFLQSGRGLVRDFDNGMHIMTTW